MKVTGSALLVALLGCGAPETANAYHCPLNQSLVVVETQKHLLTLCENGVAKKEFHVALGRGGTGKRVRGDAKTPLGQYVLGQPRASQNFGIFIPIGYPTVSQVKEGLTGSDVGVHGPQRGFRWTGSLSAWFDWTLGCVAVPSDSAISEIADWVKARLPLSIRID